MSLEFSTKTPIFVSSQIYEKNEPRGSLTTYELTSNCRSVNRRSSRRSVTFHGQNYFCLHYMTTWKIETCFESGKKGLHFGMKKSFWVCPDCNQLKERNRALKLLLLESASKITQDSSSLAIVAWYWSHITLHL